ncbi:MAG: MG2 domain-containing protein [Verrucomicrobia bacterium]|nr:MG2 domain-containing protein [Verrucomicrobiota bacterium]
MNISRSLHVLIVPFLLASSLALSAAPREAEWKKVGEATENDQEQTAISLLKPLQTAAFAARAWGEGSKALAMRVALEGEIAGSQSAAIKKLTAEAATAPAEARPILRLLQARWLLAYYQENRWEFASRSATTVSSDDDFETWDISRILVEIDRRMQDSLADKPALQKIPIAEFTELLKPGDLGDELRPTLYDFIAHSALEFYSMEEVAVAKPQDAFEIETDSAAFDSTAAFLAWHPQPPDPSSPKLRALQLYQDLLTFHQADLTPTAFLHCDLERLRWAGKAAVGPTKATRLDAALRAFIDAHAKHPLSADARQEVAKVLIEKHRTKEAHDFAKIGADAFPKHPFGKLCGKLVADLEAKSIKPETETQWTPAGAVITIRHANLSHVWFRALRREWTPDANSLIHHPAPRDETEQANLLNQKPDLAWDAALPDDKDFLQRTTTLPAPANLAPGYYLIIASTSADFPAKDKCISYLPVHVTNLAMIVRRRDANFDGLVTDAVTGAPREGVEVSIWHSRKALSKPATEATKTNADGWFSLPITPEDADVLVVAHSKDDFASTRQSAGLSSFHDNEAATLRKIVFFTDRSIYRPGQTVHFKGIYCEADRETRNYRTLAGKQATVALLNSNNKEIQSLEVRTNEYGSFSGTFTAPGGGLLGYCHIAVKGLGTTTIRVEEYKRPKFFAAIKPPAAPAALGAKVTLTGKAEAYTGAAIDGAKVTWNIYRTADWPDWVDRYARITRADSDEKEIANGTATTAADGSFAITFTASPDLSIDPQTEPVFTFDVSADVTDAAGETHSARYTVNVGYTTLKAWINTDEWQEEGKPVVFRVFTQSHDDEGRPAEGALTIYRLQEPESCPRGHARNRYSYEEPPANPAESVNPADPDYWKLGAVVKEITVRTDQANTETAGEAEVSASLPAGIYRAVLVAKDANGRAVQAIDGFQVVKPSGGRFPSKRPFFTAATRWVVEPGQPFTLLWGSGHQTARACVEFYRDGTLLKREWSAPDRTQQTFTFTPDESMRGGITVVVTQATLNHLNEFSRYLNIPWTNKELKLRWEHFTSKLVPGKQDTWTAVVTDPQGAAATTEMVATLYDASLDAFAPQAFCLGLSRFSTGPFQGSGFSTVAVSFGSLVEPDVTEGFSIDHPFRAFIEELGIVASSPQYMTPLGGAPIGGGGGIGGGALMHQAGNAGFNATGSYVENFGNPDLSTVTARKNLRETAFFYPHLTSNDKGEVRITFTMPEALTKWRFLGFAHDKEMRSGTLEGEAVTAKDLMVQPNPPRFLREGDALDFTVKITNQSDREQSGIARLTLADAATENDATAALGIAAPDQPWTIPAKESRTLSWRLTVPDGTGFLTYKAQATSGTLSDGEEGWLPVIPRRVLLTESLALPIRDAGTKDYRFQKLLDSGKSTTLENRFVHLQVVSQPAWYAVMALPYLMEFPHECAEQTFNRYYANALARHVATANPKIRQTFDLWKITPTLESPLARNADLTGILLEETPWLNEANDQAEARRKLGLLFDDNRLGEQLELTMKKLTDMQDRDGRWPWFPGGQANEYISLYIATGFARLHALGVETDLAPALKALPRLDADLTERLAVIQQAAAKDPEILAANHLDCRVAHHLYTRTFFLKDSALKRGDQEAFEYFTAQAKKYWPRLGSRMSRAHAALALFRLGDETTARLITRSLRETAVTNEETGMSWRDAEGENGWSWWQAPIDSARSTTTSTPSKPVRFGSSNKSKFVIGTAPKPPPTPSTPCSWAAGICWAATPCCKCPSAEPRSNRMPSNPAPAFTRPASPVPPSNPSWARFNSPRPTPASPGPASIGNTSRTSPKSPRTAARRSPSRRPCLLEGTPRKAPSSNPSPAR